MYVDQLYSIWTWNAQIPLMYFSSKKFGMLVEFTVGHDLKKIVWYQQDWNNFSIPGHQMAFWGGRDKKKEAKGIVENE